MIDYAYLQRAARAFCYRLPHWAGVDAEDLAQESALAALRGRQSRKGPMQDALRRQGWIKNHRVQGYKRVQRDLRGAWSFTSEPQLTAALDVQRLLGMLTPYQRQAVELHHLEGMTEREISHRLDVPIQRVKNRIFQGLHNMRKRVQ